MSMSNWIKVPRQYRSFLALLLLRSRHVATLSHCLLNVNAILQSKQLLLLLLLSLFYYYYYHYYYYYYYYYHHHHHHHHLPEVFCQKCS